MIIHKQLAFVMVISLLLSGCACSKQSSAPLQEDPSLSMAKGNQIIEGELDLAVGGAKSKGFEDAAKRGYRPVKVTLVAGTNTVSLGSDRNAVKDHFVAGIESSEGKRILQLLDEEKPWGWESVEGTRFADNVYFTGNVRERKWRYASVYPDAKLESLLARVRSVLQRR